MNSALVNRKRVKNGGNPGKSKAGIYRRARLKYNGEQLGGEKRDPGPQDPDLFHLCGHDTRGTPTLTKQIRTLARLGNLLYLPPRSTIKVNRFFFRPFYLKCTFKVFNVTFHLVLAVRKCSNFPPFFIWVSARFPSPWTFTITHHVDLGTLKAMGSLPEDQLQLTVKF